MNRKLLVGGAAVGTMTIAGLAFLTLQKHEVRSAARNEVPRVELPRAAAPLAAFAAKEENSPLPERRVAASRARMTLAYASAKRGDWSAARAGFERAAVVAKDAKAMDPGFGTLADQAAYQALVCLAQEKPKSEAIAAFRAFIEDRPESPLVHAAHRRLGKLRGGDPNAEDDALLQAAVTKQEKRIRFETSVCGPKAISELLRRTGRKDPGYVAVAKMCGTTDDGTTMAGMRRGLKVLGISAVGAELNRIDFARAATPLLLLEADHYVLVLSRTERGMRVYDPRFDAEVERALPPLDDREFRAFVLSPELPPGDYDAGPPPKPATRFPKRPAAPTPHIVDVPTSKPSSAISPAPHATLPNGTPR